MLCITWQDKNIKRASPQDTFHKALERDLAHRHFAWCAACMNDQHMRDCEHTRTLIFNKILMPIYAHVDSFCRRSSSLAVRAVVNVSCNRSNLLKTDQHRYAIIAARSIHRHAHQSTFDVAANFECRAAVQCLASRKQNMHNLVHWKLRLLACGLESASPLSQLPTIDETRSTSRARQMNASRFRTTAMH
jgi:hypothetical protein